MNRAFLLLGVLVLALCQQGIAKRKQTSGQPSTPSSYVLQHVNVLPMSEGSQPISNATVVIQDGRIVAINGPLPTKAKVIEAKGKWLLPGLIDMHVHIPVDGHFNTRYPTRAASIFSNTQDIMTPFVTNGVTTVLELNARGGHLGQRNEILRGSVIGPRMALAAMILAGKADGRLANTPADGRQSVRLAKAEGYEFIKVYSELSVETFKAIVDEARLQGMKVVGHIPTAFQGRTEELFVPHFGMVAHAEEYAKQSPELSTQDAQRFAQLAKANGTWLCPTLVVIQRSWEQSRSLDSVRYLGSLPYVHPLLQHKWLMANNNYRGTSTDRVARKEQLLDFNRRLVQAFRNEGVPMVAGTDAGSSGVVWGFSLHEELELLVAAGMSPDEALTSATRLAANWLGLDSLIGTVAPGKYADLLLLDANPLEDIRNTRKIAGVFVNGRWLDRRSIHRMLAELAQRNAATKDQWDWSRREEY